MHSLLTEVSGWGWASIDDVTTSVDDDGDTLVAARVSSGSVEATFRRAPGEVEVEDRVHGGTYAYVEPYLAVVTCRIPMGPGEGLVRIEGGMVNIFCNLDGSVERVWYDGPLGSLPGPTRVGINMLCAQMTVCAGELDADEPF